MTLGLFLLAFYPLGTGIALNGFHAERPSSWQTLPEALEQSARERLPVLIYVRAPWCGPCVRMEKETFSQLEPLLNRFARAQLEFDDHDGRIDVGAARRSPAAWAGFFGAEVTPTLVLLDPTGAVISRVSGFQDARRLGFLLGYVATGAHRHASFDQYVQRVTERK